LESRFTQNLKKIMSVIRQYQNKNVQWVPLCCTVSIEWVHAWCRDGWVYVIMYHYCIQKTIVRRGGILLISLHRSLISIYLVLCFFEFCIEQNNLFCNYSDAVDRFNFCQSIPKCFMFWKSNTKFLVFSIFHIEKP
jgi:hypothetical protein